LIKKLKFRSETKSPNFGQKYLACNFKTLLAALGAQTNTGIIGAVRVNDTHEYECDALVDLNKRSVDQNVFKTLNNACLVYDGALIVDTNFSTSQS